MKLKVWRIYDFASHFKTDFGSHFRTIIACILTILATVLPLMMGLIVTFVRDRWEGFFPFYSSGEFYIYSAGLLGPACFILFRYKRDITDLRSLAFFLSGLVAFVASFLYGLLLVDRCHFDTNILKFTSFAIFAYTIIVFYYASYVLEQKLVVNVQEMAREEVDEIKDALGGDEHGE